MSRTYSASSMASSSVLPGCEDIRYGTTNCFSPQASLACWNSFTNFSYT